MIVSTCETCGREQTTRQFVNTCTKPRCTGTMAVQMIIDDEKEQPVDIYTRLLIAEQKTLAALETAHAAEMRALDDYIDNPTHTTEAATQTTRLAYIAAEQRLSDIRQAIADVKHAQELLQEQEHAA